MLALFLDLSNCEVKYSLYMENSILTLSSFPKDLPAFVACSSLFENVH